MINKRIHFLNFCFLSLVLCMALTPVSWANSEEDPRGVLMAHILGISATELIVLRRETVQLMRSEGLSVKITKHVDAIDIFSLLNILNIDFDRRHLDRERLVHNLRYWRRLLGRDGSRDLFDEFITQTRHNNPFHMLNMNLHGWTVFLDLLIEWQVFSSINGPETRSFRSFANQYKWLEGVQASHPIEPKFWQTWSQALYLAGFQPQELGDAFYRKFIQTRMEKHSDGVQSMYVALNPSLLEFLLEYSEFMKIENLKKAFLVNPIAFTFIIDELKSIFNKHESPLDITETTDLKDLEAEIRSILAKNNYKFKNNILVEWSTTNRNTSKIEATNSCFSFLK